MHPRLEGVAVDHPDHLRRMRHTQHVGRPWRRGDRWGACGGSRARLAVTGPMVAPTTRPKGKRRRGQKSTATARFKCGYKSGRRNIVLDIVELQQGTIAILCGCELWSSRCKSEVRRQTLLFPVAITGWLRSAGTADLLGASRTFAAPARRGAPAASSKRTLGRRRQRLSRRSPVGLSGDACPVRCSRACDGQGRFAAGVVRRSESGA